MDEWQMQELAAYIADHIKEEHLRGSTGIDTYMVREAIDAYFGSDDGDADAANNPRILGQIFGG